MTKRNEQHETRCCTDNRTKVDSTHQHACSCLAAAAVRRPPREPLFIFLSLSTLDPSQHLCDTNRRHLPPIGQALGSIVDVGLGSLVALLVDMGQKEETSFWLFLYSRYGTVRELNVNSTCNDGRRKMKGLNERAEKWDKRPDSAAKVQTRMLRGV
jgi:hypothetical protein